MPPTSEQLVDLVHVLLRNAADLTDDARTLLEQRRWARTYALAALAGEELGKVGLCLEVLLDPAPMDGKSFARAWRSHGEKLASMTAYRVAFVDDPGEVDLARLKVGTDEVCRRKMSAIYVDITDAGTVETPCEINATEAVALLERVEGAVEHAGGVLNTLSMDLVATTRELTPQILAPVDEYLDGLEPNEVIVALRDLMTRLPLLSDAQLRAAIDSGAVRELLGLGVS
jgi:AbiV family abortive infection protein